LDLPTRSKVEDTHDAGLDLETFASRAHVAERADMVVVPEDIMFSQPEPDGCGVAAAKTSPGSLQVPSSA
jgi:hypothetical protein